MEIFRVLSLVYKAGWYSHPNQIVRAHTYTYAVDTTAQEPQVIQATVRCKDGDDVDRDNGQGQGVKL